jgi:hypothetical protein
MTKDLVQMPAVGELAREAAVPATERGQTDLWALRRLAAICFGVLIYQ